jgi:hypothetical protein
MQYDPAMRLLAEMFLAIALSAGAGCSSGGSTPGPGAGGSGGSGASGLGGFGAWSFEGGVELDCASYCDATLSANCPADDAAACVQSCTDQLVWAGPCVEGYKALLACEMKQPVTCNSVDHSQVDGAAIDENCRAEILAVGPCIVCQAMPPGADCVECAATQCCQENAAAIDGDYVDYDHCRRLCDDLACLDACDAQYPNVLAKKAAADACRKQKCGC